MESTSQWAVMARAAERGNVATVASLLESGVSTEAPDGGWGALKIAAYHGRTEVVRFLLQHGAVPTDVLITTANMGRVAAVKELLAVGARVDEVDETNGWTALHYAVRPDGPFHQGHIRVVRTLLSAGADPDARDNSGRTPLCFLMNADHRVAEALLRAGANVNAQDRGGYTPLFHAAMRGESANVGNFILSYGADPHIKDNSGRTAVGVAGSSGAWSTHFLIDFLIQVGLKPNALDRDAIMRQLDELQMRLQLLFDQEA